MMLLASMAKGRPVLRVLSHGRYGSVLEALGIDKVARALPCAPIPTGSPTLMAALTVVFVDRMRTAVRMDMSARGHRHRAGRVGHDGVWQAGMILSDV
jgi:hypothetical protein